MKNYKALVIGCGNIGSIFGEPGNKEILSHAQAYTAHPAFTLQGVVDIDFAKAQTAARKWKAPVFSSLDEALRKSVYDVVSICVSTKEHANVLRQVIAASPKVIILEKPVTNTLNESEQLSAQLKGCTSQVLVHYTRRFMPEFQMLKEKIQHDEFGAFISGHCYYSKGVLNNGSHAVDLMRFFLGEARVISVFSGRVDFSSEDPTLSFSMGLKPGGVFCLLEADQRFSPIFEIELLFEKRRVCISEIKMAIEEFVLQPDPLWKGSQQWTLQKTTKIDFGNALPAVLSHAVELIEHKIAPRCSLLEGIASQRLCAQALDEFKRKP